MKKRTYKWLLYGGLLFLFTLNCTEKEAVEPVNNPPTVEVTPFYTITLPVDSVVLVGDAADSDGYIASYKRTKVDGPPDYQFADPTKAITKVDKLVKGMYGFLLTVTDDKGLSKSKMSIVKVVTVGACPCEPNCDDYGDPCDPWDY